MSMGEDGIPHDFPWDDCRMLYSNPDSFTVKFLHGRSDQDYQFLVRSAFVDAKSILSEWLKLHSHPADDHLKNIVYHNCDYHFLARIYRRVSMLPGEQYFLLISILFFAQCKQMNALVLAERFFSTHELIHQKKINPININAPDLSWVDLAELLADSLDEIRPTVESHLPPGTLPKTATEKEKDNHSKQNKKRKRNEEEIPTIQPDPPQRQRRTRIANTNSDYEYDIPQISAPANNHNTDNNSNSSLINSAFEKAFHTNNSRSEKDKQPYFVVPKSLAELLQQSISDSNVVNVTEDDHMLHIRPLPNNASNSVFNCNKGTKSILQRSMYSNLTGQKMKKSKLTNMNNNAMMRSHVSTDSLSGYNRSPQKIGGLDDSAGSTDNLSAAQDTNSVGNKHANSFYARDMDAVSISRGSAYYSHGNKSHLIVPNAYNLSQLQCDAGLDTGYQMLDSNNNMMFTATSTVARRQKKNKKLFHVLLLDMDNWQGHYSGGCSAAASSSKSHHLNASMNAAMNVNCSAVNSSQDSNVNNTNNIKLNVTSYHNTDKNMVNKLGNVPVLDISDPLSIKGVVALASHRFRIQLNAFQNEKRKFSRNCNDLHEAMWIFEVTLLISDGSKTLEGQLKIGNYLPMCQLGHRFQVYANPLEYFFELARQVTGFLHRAEVFPEELIHLAVSYLDNMTMGPKELMSEEELNMSEELFALQNPVLLPIWRPIADCFRYNHRLKFVKEVLNQVSQGTITSILQLFADPATPPLFRIPKLIIQPVVDPTTNGNDEDNDTGILAQGDSHNGTEDNKSMDNNDNTYTNTNNSNNNDYDEGAKAAVKLEQPARKMNAFPISTTNNVKTVNMDTETHRKPAVPQVKKLKLPAYGSVSGFPLMYHQHPATGTAATTANGAAGGTMVPHQFLQNIVNSTSSVSSMNETVLTTDSSVVVSALANPKALNKTSIVTDNNAPSDISNTPLKNTTSNNTSHVTPAPSSSEESGGVIHHSDNNLSFAGTSEAYIPRLVPKITNTTASDNIMTNNTNNNTTIVKPSGDTGKSTLSPFQLLPSSTLIDTSNRNYCSNNPNSNNATRHNKALIPLSHPSKIPPTAKTAGVKFSEIQKRRRKSKENKSVVANAASDDIAASHTDNITNNNNTNNTVNHNNYNNNDTEAVFTAASTAYSTSVSSTVSTSDSTTERDTHVAALTLANILATASAASNI